MAKMFWYNKAEFFFGVSFLFFSVLAYLIKLLKTTRFYKFRLSAVYNHYDILMCYLYVHTIYHVNIMTCSFWLLYFYSLFFCLGSFSHRMSTIFVWKSTDEIWSLLRIMKTSCGSLLSVGYNVDIYVILHIAFSNFGF